MRPTLIVGDHILVNKFIYGIKLPFTDKILIPLSEPERGDVVVFKFPLDTKKDYIKRVIGLPGDVVSYRSKRLYINGEPVPYALARIPAQGETRGNLAAGGTGRGQPINDRDREIVAAVGPTLRKAGILFAGLDVIGDWLTEINVTSPTCIRELDAQFGLNIAGTLLDAIEDQLANP